MWWLSPRSHKHTDTHAHTHSLAHSLTHSYTLTRSLTHSLTHARALRHPCTGLISLFPRYFCSNLVALALVKIGALANDVSDKEASCYLPKAFEPGGEVDDHLATSFLLGPPLLCFASRPPA